MGAIIFGVVALAVLLVVLHGFSKANPRNVAVVLKATGGVGALAGAALLGARGRIDIAVPLGIFGLGLLGWLPFGPAGFGARTQKSTGQVSRVRSAFIEMELDHDTGDDARHHPCGPACRPRPRRTRRRDADRVPAGYRRRKPRATDGVS